VSHSYKTANIFLSWPYFVACRPTHTHIRLRGAITRQFIFNVRVRLIGYLHFQRFVFQLFNNKKRLTLIFHFFLIENQEQINEKLWEIGHILLKTNRKDAFEYYYRSRLNWPMASALGLLLLCDDKLFFHFFVLPFRRSRIDKLYAHGRSSTSNRWTTYLTVMWYNAVLGKT